MNVCIITRAQPGAQVSAEGVAGLGRNPLVIPAAIVSSTDAKVDVSGVQALLMTSAAAARHLQTSLEVRALPVYAVGDATAQAAREAGFEQVISAGGDGATLAVLAADRMKPATGALLHVRGSEVAGDVTSMLRACGFATHSLEVYHTIDHGDFQRHVCAAINEHHGLIVLHSPAGARRLLAAVTGQTLQFGQWRAIGLSPACLAGLADLGFSDLISAQQPDEAALLATIAAL
jgi:uroporphyrinogen-III synthase